MLCLFKDGTTLTATELQTAIQAIAAPTPDAKIQERRGAKREFTLDANGKITGYSDRAQTARISGNAKWPSGKAVALDDFPAHMQFGNGVSRILYKGERPDKSYTMVVVIFPDSAIANVNNNYEAIRQIIEGV